MKLLYKIVDFIMWAAIVAYVVVSASWIVTADYRFEKLEKRMEKLEAKKR